MLRALLLALALTLPAAALAATPPTAFSAEYEVFQNGKKLGTGRIALRDAGGGRWEITTHSEATQGLIGAAGVRRTETSLVDFSTTPAQAVEYRMQQKAAWSERNQHLVVDAAARRATSQYKDDTYNLTWQPGLIDKHGLTAVLMSELAAGRRGDMTFPIAERRDVENQTYRTAANVILTTAIGKERAVRVERVRNDDTGRVTKIWFARERGWLPLRIKQYESDGGSIDLRIVRVQ